MRVHKRRFGWVELCLWGGTLLIAGHLLPRTAHIYSLWWQTRAEVQALTSERQALAQEKLELKAQIERASTPLGKETLARERGWLKPEELPLQIKGE